MELILIAILALVLLGGVDRRLYPDTRKRVTAPTRRRVRRAPVHRLTPDQVRPFLSLGSLPRR